MADGQTAAVRLWLWPWLDVHGYVEALAFGLAPFGRENDGEAEIWVEHRRFLGAQLDADAILHTVQVHGDLVRSQYQPRMTSWRSGK